MKLENKIKKLFPNMKKGIERFPVTILFSGVLFILLTEIIERYNIFKPLEGQFFIEIQEWAILLAIGIPIVTALEFLREVYFDKKNKWIFRAAYFILTLLFLLLCKQLYLNGSTIFFYKKYKLWAIGITGYMMFLLLPVMKGEKDEEKYLQSIVGNKFITIGFSIVLYLGIAAIITLIDVLLININKRLYEHFFVFTVFIFGVTFFVSRIKDSSDNLKTYEIPKIIKVLLSYIIVPLMTVYIIILYLYSIKSLLTLKIPKGIASNFILWYMVFSLFIIVMITPLTKENKFLEKFKKIHTVFSIPMIVIGIVSILERISQYGIIEKRYVGVILLFWILFCKIFYTFKTDVKVIIISFIATVLFISYGPFNMVDVSVKSQNKRLEKLLIENGLLVDGRLVKNDNVSKEAKGEIMSIVEYFTYYSHFENKIRDLKSFEKDGKPYETRKEFLDKIGADNSWLAYAVETAEKVGEIENNKNYEIQDVDGYKYYVELMIGEVTYEKTSSSKYNVKVMKEKEILIYNKEAENESIKINIDELEKEVITNLKSEIENGKKSNLKVPKEKLVFEDENSFIKYKVEFKTIMLSDNYEPDISRIVLYFIPK